MVRHGPADDLAGRHVLDRGQVEEALAGWDVRDIRQPDRVRTLGDEVTAEQVGGNRQVVPAIGRPGCPAAAPVGGQAHLAHQLLDPPSRMPPSLSAELSVDPWRTVNPAPG